MNIRAILIVLISVFTMSLTLNAAEKGYIKPRLAVITFETKNVDDATIQTITELMQSLFENSGLYTLVERTQIDKIYEEQKLQYNGSVDESTAIQIGKMLGANKLVLGSVNKIEKQFIITSRVVDVQSGEIEISGSRRTDLLDIRECAGDLVRSLVEHDRREYELCLPSTYRKKGTLAISIETLTPFFRMPASQQTINGTTLIQPEIIFTNQLIGPGISYMPSDNLIIKCTFIPKDYIQNYHNSTFYIRNQRGEIYTGTIKLLKKLSERLDFSIGCEILRSWYSFDAAPSFGGLGGNSPPVTTYGEKIWYTLGSLNSGFNWMPTKRLGITVDGKYYFGNIDNGRLIGTFNQQTFPINLCQPEPIPFGLQAAISYYF